MSRSKDVGCEKVSMFTKLISLRRRKVRAIQIKRDNTWHFCDLLTFFFWK
jgi:hypothetical protein